MKTKYIIISLFMLLVVGVNKSGAALICINQPCLTPTPSISPDTSPNSAPLPNTGSVSQNPTPTPSLESRITTLEADNLAFSNRLTALESVNQSLLARLAALEADNRLLHSQINTLSSLSSAPIPTSIISSIPSFSTPTPAAPASTSTPTPISKLVNNQVVDILNGALVRVKGESDVYIVKYVGTKRFKHKILSPSVFSSYDYFHWSDIKDVDQSVVDSFITSDLVRATGDDKVYRLYPQGDTGQKRWVKTTAAFAKFGLEWDSVYETNSFERDSYITGTVLE